MKLKTTLLGKTYEFRSLKEVLAKANEEKTGDKLAGLAAETAQERVAAKVVLAAVTLQDLRENPAVPYEKDEVTRIIQDDLNTYQYEKIKGWTTLIVPLVIGAMRRSQQMGVAMDTRAFGASKKRTYIEELKTRPSDWIALGVAILIAAGLLFCNYAVTLTRIKAG